MLLSTIILLPQSSNIIDFLNMASYLYKQKLSNQSQDEDYYVLQPMFERHPPNQIISEKYAPDVIAQVRLINGKDERKNNIHYVPPKTRSQELEGYAGCFGHLDFLGKEYADKINQIVYLKFNNSKCNTIPNRKARVLSAAYVPFQQFTSSISKLVNIPFPDSTQNAMLPTAKDSRGCSFDPIFCSNYQHSNLYAAFRKNPFEYDLILQSDTNSCQTVSWFNFSIQFLQEGYYTFKIVNLTEDMSKVYEKGLKINYSYLNPLTNRQSKKTGQGWGLCGENIKFTQGKIQREDKPGKFYYQLSFEFKCKNKHDIVLFAPQVPYGLLESEKFFNKILFKKIKNMLRIEKIEYGKTLSGSPLVAYQIRRKKGRGESIQMTPTVTQTLLQGKDKRKSINLSPINKSLSSQIANKSVIILGRVKAADNNGSFIMEGMIDYLLDTIQFQSMKRVFDFYFIPLVNNDGVRFGNSQTNLTGSLLNNNWKNPSKYYQSEIYQLKDLLQQINKENPLSLIVNLTTDREDIYSSVIGCKNDSQDTEDSRIFPFILSKRFRMFSFQKSAFFLKNQNSSMCCVLSELFPKTLVYQFNISHFQASKRNDQNLSNSHILESQPKQSNPDTYRIFGKELLSNYLEHVKLYDKNLLLRQKWVKQIQQIENKMTKKIVNFIEDRKVQQKFPEDFYYVPIQKQRTVPLIKSAKTSISTKLLNPPKVFDIQRLSRDIKREKLVKPMLPHSFNDFIGKRNQTEGYLRTKIQLNGENKKLQLQEVINQKQMPLFRVGDKKTSILLNCPSNTLNFQAQGDKIGNKSSKKQKNILEKQILKKELLTKLLRKVKIQDTVKGWKNKQRASDIKLGEIFSNS